MPSPIVQAGYMGYVEVDSYKVRCTDFNVKLKQDAVFYDHTIGLRDSIPAGILDSKGDDASFNEQKIFWRASTKIIEGSINFPLVELSTRAFFYQAYTGEDFDVNVYYSCDTGKTFTLCKVNTYSMTITAGEPTNVSVGIMGIDVLEGSAPTPYEEPEKIVTYDAVKIEGSGADTGIVSFEFTINNNCIPIYTAGTNIGDPSAAVPIAPLLAHKIRVGMQTVTGSITFYNDIGPADEFVESLIPREIKISIGDTFAAKLNVLYQYPERTGQVSPYIRTIPFVGVGEAVQDA